MHIKNLVSLYEQLWFQIYSNILKTFIQLRQWYVKNSERQRHWYHDTWIRWYTSNNFIAIKSKTWSTKSLNWNFLQSSIINTVKLSSLEPTNIGLFASKLRSIRLFPINWSQDHFDIFQLKLFISLTKISSWMVHMPWYFKPRCFHTSWISS